LAVRTATLAFVREQWPRLQLHYDWFVRTQAGPYPGESFRWRGAMQDHSLASGLDDYPRGMVPTASDESLDLLSWMGMFADIMASLATGFGTEEQARKYSMAGRTFAARLDRHWNHTAGMFCDIGVVSAIPPPNTPANRYKTQAQLSAETMYSLGHVCHLGYVSIMPLLHRLLDPTSLQFELVLEAVSSPDHMWSPFGLRSLAASDELYRTLEDYWRSPVWININYLAVSSLRYYSTIPTNPHAARCRRLADELAENVINIMTKEFRRTGFVWEQYDCISGKGKGTHPFTGWSALVALMIANRYPI
jgi:mannosyl-oligosaccharide glucosidase